MFVLGLALVLALLAVVRMFSEEEKPARLRLLVDLYWIVLDLCWTVLPGKSVDLCSVPSSLTADVSRLDSRSDLICSLAADLADL